MQRVSTAVCAGFAVFATIGAAQAFDESKYPDLKGQWNRTAAPRWELAAKAPLTPEYRAVYEANVKDQEEGGQGDTPTFTCLSPGMPRVMNAYEPFEIVVTPGATHFLMDHIHDSAAHPDGRPQLPRRARPELHRLLHRQMDRRGRRRPLRRAGGRDPRTARAAFL